MAAFPGLIILCVNAETINQKQYGKESSQKKHPEAMDGQRLPGIECHRQQKDRFSQFIGKGQAEPVQIPMAVEAYSKDIFPAAGIDGKASGSGGLG